VRDRETGLRHGGASAVISRRRATITTSDNESTV